METPFIRQLICMLLCDQNFIQDMPSSYKSFIPSSLFYIFIGTVGTPPTPFTTWHASFCALLSVMLSFLKQKIVQIGFCFFVPVLWKGDHHIHTFYAACFSDFIMPPTAHFLGTHFFLMNQGTSAGLLLNSTVVRESGYFLWILVRLSTSVDPTLMKSRTALTW